jgi:capsular exopolysaccharide synthesis family protein
VQPASIQASTALAKDPASSVAEAYRMLRTSILLAAAGHPPKTILMTSSQPGEGKTTTSVNIGICLSQMGAKVLIIDADMRCPRVHKIFGLNHRRGLSSYLSSDLLLKNVVQATQIPNLWVLPSGLVPPNSADLLSSEKMHTMLEKLSDYFDHILIDSPPVSSVTDPVLLSRLVDGVVMVIHGGKSSREMVIHTRQELHNVGAKIFGVVLNNVNMQRDGYDYYYYRRYQYEYGRDSNGLN